MYSLLLLMSIAVICQGIMLMLPPGPLCACINPFSDQLQSHFGGKILNCKNRGVCYVDCDSDCGDVHPAGGVTVKKGRCISKAACHTAAETSKSPLDFFTLDNAGSPDSKPDKPIVSRFVLSGTGLVAGYQGHGLGMYTYNTDTGYYKQEGGDYYLMRDRGKDWYTFPHISGCDKADPFSCIAQYAANLKTKNLTGNHWSFGKDNVWSQDDSIQFGPLKSNSCLQCSTIILSSTGPAIQAQPQYFGTFEKMPFIFSAGRPVYKNKEGKHLMMKNEYTTFSVWDDTERRVSAGKGGDEGTRGLRSGSGPTCVTDLAGGMHGRNEQGWQYHAKSGGWVQDKSISVTCAGY